MKELVGYYNEVEENKLKDEVANTIYIQIDNKLKKYLSINYSKYAKYIEYPIILWDGSEFIKFYNLSRLIIGSRNYQTGDKGSINIEKYSEEEFILNTNFDNGQELKFVFKPYKNKLVFRKIVDARDGWDDQSNIFRLISTKLTAYPEIEHVDYELLDQY